MQSGYLNVKQALDPSRLRQNYEKPFIEPRTIAEKRAWDFWKQAKIFENMDHIFTQYSPDEGFQAWFSRVSVLK